MKYDAINYKPLNSGKADELVRRACYAVGSKRSKQYTLIELSELLGVKSSTLQSWRKDSKDARMPYWAFFVLTKIINGEI